MIRNVIFDWSGTLVDDLPAVLAATNHVFRHAGREAITRDTFRAEFCLPYKDFYDRFIPNFPLDRLEVLFHEHFGTLQHTITPLPYAMEFLQALQEQNVRCFALTAVPEGSWRKQAATAGFGEFFEHAYTGVIDKRLVILELMAAHKIEPGETLFVGDMQHDMDAAREGGVHSCGVLTGYNSVDQLRQSEPELIVEHLGELLQFLKRHEWEWVDSPKARAVEQHPIATVGALIYNSNGEILMVRTHKWSNKWGIPGGKIRFGEPSEEALKRELMEETNLEVSEVEFVLVQDCIHSTEFYRDAHFILLNYRCRAEKSEGVKLNDEAQEYRWLRPGEALQLNLNRPTEILLRAVLEKGARFDTGGIEPRTL